MVESPVTCTSASKRIAEAPEAFGTDVVSAIALLLDAVVIFIATQTSCGPVSGTSSFLTGLVTCGAAASHANPFGPARKVCSLPAMSPSGSHQRHLVVGEPFVVRDECQSLLERLGNQHPVERIIVMPGQPACREAVHEADW